MKPRARISFFITPQPDLPHGLLDQLVENGQIVEVARL